MEEWKKVNNRGIEISMLYINFTPPYMHLEYHACSRFKGGDKK